MAVGDAVAPEIPFLVSPERIDESIGGGKGAPVTYTLGSFIQDAPRTNLGVELPKTVLTSPLEGVYDAFGDGHSSPDFGHRIHRWA